MDQTPQERDAAISQYVIRLQERYPEFARERRLEMRLRGHDSLSQAFAESLGSTPRESYEKQLGEMLTDEERQLLRHDPNFSEAWRVFMDLRWIRKQLERMVVLALLVLFILVVAVGLAWTFYQFVISLLSPPGK